MGKHNSTNDIIAEHVKEGLLSEVGWMLYFESAQ